MKTAPSLDARLLNLTDDLIARGACATEALKAATKIIEMGEHKPWLTPDETAILVNLAPKSVRKSASAGEFSGARKICGQWRIPRAAITPEVRR